MSGALRSLREGRTPVDAGVELRWLEWEGSGPPLVCLHGLTAHAHGFAALAEALPGRRVVAIDLRGRGASDRSPGGAYGLVRHADDVAALLEREGFGPVPVLGHSMGGYVTALLAVRHPQCVSHAVLADGGHPDPSWTDHSLRAQISTALARLSLVLDSPDDYIETWRANAFAQPWTARWDAYVRHDLAARQEGGFVCRAAADAVEQDLRDIVHRYDPAAVLPQVRVPALSVWAPVGLADPSRPLVPEVAMRGAADLMPQGRFLEVAGANHYTLLLDDGHAATVARAVEQLVQEEP